MSAGIHTSAGVHRRLLVIHWHRSLVAATAHRGLLLSVNFFLFGVARLSVVVSWGTIRRGYVSSIATWGGSVVSRSTSSLVLACSSSTSIVRVLGSTLCVWVASVARHLTTS